MPYLCEDCGSEEYSPFEDGICDFCYNEREQELTQKLHDHNLLLKRHVDKLTKSINTTNTMSESNFILRLIENGVTVEQVKAMKKWFWKNERLNMESPTVQAVMLTGPSEATLAETLLAKANELEEAEKAKKQ